MKRDTREFLQDIIDTVEEAMASRPPTYEQYRESLVHQRALIWLVQCVGEGCTKVPKDVQAGNPQIPWRAIIGARHRIVHNYTDVDADVIWKVVTEDLPFLAPQIMAILADLPDDEQ